MSTFNQEQCSEYIDYIPDCVSGIEVIRDECRAILSELQSDTTYNSVRVFKSLVKASNRLSDLFSDFTDSVDNMRDVYYLTHKGL